MFPFMGLVPEGMLSSTDIGAGGTAGGVSAARRDDEPLANDGDGRGEAQLAMLVANLNDFNRVAGREEQHVAVLRQGLPGTPVIRVPFLADDVHDIAGLSEIGRWLFDTSPEGWP
jgi:hypothetical protein